MKRGIDRQPPRANSLAIEPRQQTFHGLGRAGHHRLSRAVDGSEEHIVAEGLQRGGELCRRGHQGRHPAGARQGLRQAGAGGDEEKGFLHGEDAGCAGRGVLAHPMPEHGRRLDAPFLPQLHQRVLQRKQRRLGVGGLREQPILPGRVQQLAERTVQRISQGGVAAIDRLAKDRLGVVKFAAHAGVLGALAGEEEDDLSAGRFHVALDTTRLCKLPEPCLQANPGLVARGRGQGQPMAEMSPSGVGRKAHVGKIRLGMLVKMPGEPLGQLPQRRRRLRRKGQEMERAVLDRRTRNRPATLRESRGRWCRRCRAN